MDEDHKEFLATNNDHQLANYIEKRAKDGDTHQEIKHDLVNGGHEEATVDDHMQYVSKHKTNINHHGIYWQLLFFGLGLFIFLIIGAAIWYFLK